jgi:hypothetical protein
MNDAQRLKLQQMISTNNVEDQTQLIRNLKHSEILRSNINNLIELKNKYGNDVNSEYFTNEAMLESNFLFTYYTDIYNKIKKDEIDLQLLYKFLNILKSIEDGEKDQHEASYDVGTILKEIYIDSALKKAEKLDENNENKEEYRGPDINLSWNQFKCLNKNKKYTFKKNK